MLVYRLQHRITGKGPYASQSSIGWLDDICGVEIRRNSPEPDSDALLLKNYKERFPAIFSMSRNLSGIFIFGFINPEQLKKWFGSSGIMKLLAHHGFEVAVKDIPDDKVIVGDSQCMIDSEAWFETPITTLWIPERYAERWSYDEVKEI